MSKITEYELITDAPMQFLTDNDPVFAWRYPALHKRIEAVGTDVVSQFLKSLFRKPGAKANCLFMTELPECLRIRRPGPARVHPLLLTIVDDGYVRCLVKGKDITKKVKLPDVTWDNIRMLGMAAREGASNVHLDFIRDYTASLYEEPTALTDGGANTAPAQDSDTQSEPGVNGEVPIAEESSEGTPTEQILADHLQRYFNEYPDYAIQFIRKTYEWSISSEVTQYLGSREDVRDLMERKSELEDQVKFWRYHPDAGTILPVIEGELNRVKIKLSIADKCPTVPYYIGSPCS